MFKKRAAKQIGATAMPEDALTALSVAKAAAKPKAVLVVETAAPIKRKRKKAKKASQENTVDSFVASAAQDPLPEEETLPLRVQEPAKEDLIFEPLFEEDMQAEDSLQEPAAEPIPEDLPPSPSDAAATEAAVPGRQAVFTEGMRIILNAVALEESALRGMVTAEAQKILSSVAPGEDAEYAVEVNQKVAKVTSEIHEMEGLLLRKMRNIMRAFPEELSPERGPNAPDSTRARQ